MKTEYLLFTFSTYIFAISLKQSVKKPFTHKLHVFFVTTLTDAKYCITFNKGYD